MSLDINLTGVEITSNKKTTLTDNSDTFYPTQKAVKTAVDLKQNTLGFTPENVANLSTDVNTDQASNTKYPSVKAVYDWAVGLFVPSSRTINGLDLSANRTLTTADIADSSNKRYVTDAQLTVIGNTSGTNTGDQTFLTPRVQTIASSATVTAVSTNDLVTITGQLVGLTLANPTGAFVEGQSLIFRIKDNGTERSIAYGTNFRAIGVIAPTTTVANKTTYIGCIYNSTDTKFDIIGVCTEA